MRGKQILFRSEAREAVLRGATRITDAIRVTLGPKSKCVLIEKKWGTPIVCNDGVTIAKEFELENATENLGAQMIRQAAEKTGEKVDDGTSTSAVLAQALYAEGVKNIAAGAGAIDLKRGLDRGLAAAVAALARLSRPVTTRLEKVQVATISAHNDLSIGEQVAAALEKVGPEGIVSVEEAKGIETTVEVVEGMQLDRGYLSPYFVTDPARMEAILEDCYVLLLDQKITSMKDFLPLLESVAKQAAPFLIIAESIEGEALATLVINKLRGVLQVCAVKAPGFGDRRKEMLQDLAILTGARLFCEELGTSLENAQLEDLGKCQKVIARREETIIIGGKGAKEAIEARRKELRAGIETAKSDYDREKLQERLAKITGGVAVVRVGAASEAELKNRKEAFDDAITATKAAVEEGIVPGGGLALLRMLPEIENVEAACEGDERTGVRILKRALEAPTRQIAENSNFDPGVVVDRMKAGTGNYGFDAAKGQYVDLVQAGIVDPTKVVRVALENAISVAGILLLTEAVLTEAPEPAKTEEAPMVA